MLQAPRDPEMQALPQKVLLDAGPRGPAQQEGRGGRTKLGEFKDTAWFIGHWITAPAPTSTAVLRGCQAADGQGPPDVSGSL